MPHSRSTSLLLALIPVVFLWLIAAVLAHQVIGEDGGELVAVELATRL
jgi:hypothetical protein